MLAARCPRPFRWSLAVTVAVTLLVGPGIPTRASAEPAAPAREALDMTSAMATARRTGQAVEVISARTETMQLYANPSGTVTMKQYAMPQRVRRGAAWLPIDTSLQRDSDGSYTPAATTVDLNLSDGGEGPFVTITKDGKSLSLSWPEPLPTPTVDTDTVTYPEVLPGVDLRVQADTEGFSQALVVKTRDAAANPALAELRYRTATTGGLTLHVGADGHTVAQDGTGGATFVSGTPMMWDTPPDSDGSSAPRSSRYAAMPLTLDGSDLVITPDQSMLSDPTTSFPVYIDPSYTGRVGPQNWTHVNENSPNDSYWFYDRAEGAKVGYSNWKSPIVTYRSYFQMVTSPINGAIVKRTWFGITLDHSADCSASPVDLWETDFLNSSVDLTWANSVEGHWNRQLASRSGNANGGCGQGDFPMEFSSATLTSLVQSVATSGRGWISLGLRAPDENNEWQWKLFHPTTAHIAVEYNHVPNPPTGLSTRNPITTCGAASSPTPINTTTPTFGATHSDPNGDNVTSTLDVLADEAVIHSVSSSTTLNGSAFTWSPIPTGKLSVNATYSYRARTWDGSDWGPYTARCYFTIDETPPGMPTIESTDYPDFEPVKQIGEVGIVTFRPAAGDTDIGSYRYGFQQDRLGISVPAAPNGIASVPITIWKDPDTGLTRRTLYVQAVDKAGNISGPTVGWTLAARDRPGPYPRVQGDVNGDGISDPTALYNFGDQRSGYWNFLQKVDGIHPTTLGWDTGINGGYNANTINWTRGDFDGDGLADVAVFRPIPGTTKLDITVLKSNGNGYDATLALPATEGSGWYLNRARFLSGDFNGDGRDDIALHYDWTNYEYVFWTFLSTSTATVMSFANAAEWWHNPQGAADWTREKPVAGDFNGDGRADIGFLYDYGSNTTRLWVHYSSGTTFGAAAMLWESQPGEFAWSRAKMIVGDFGGDGKADIGYFYNYAGISGYPPWIIWVHQSTGSSFAAPANYGSPVGTNDWNYLKPVTGDYDGDGLTDVAYFYHYGNQQTKLWYRKSSGTSFGSDTLRWDSGSGTFDWVIAGFQ